MPKFYTQRDVDKMIKEATAPLLARIAELEAKLAIQKKDSSTSSKPPSSDIAKPPRSPKSRGGRSKKGRRGGQRGHARHERQPFSPEEVDKCWVYEWTDSSLTSDWEPLDEFRTIQQVELVPKLFQVTEHKARLYRNRWTGEVAAAAFPADVLCGGIAGPRLTALIAYQKGACHMSYRVTQTFLADVLGLKLSTGQLAKIVGKASHALAPAYQELQTALPGCLMVNIDETGHPENGAKFWTWGFHVPGENGFTLFHIDPTRSAEVLQEFLGETFSGVIGCDYYSAYRKFLRDVGANMQFCWAHLIRDVKFLTTLSDRVTRAFGERLLASIKNLFRIWHRRDETPDERWKKVAEQARLDVLKIARRPPRRPDAQNVADRFRKHGEHYFRFLTAPGVEPTNNAMEQRFRFVVIDRKITQGTRGANGRRWSERIWTTLATCAQQGRSAFEFIEQTITAYFLGRPTPSLATNPP